MPRPLRPLIGDPPVPGRGSSWTGSLPRTGLGLAQPRGTPPAACSSAALTGRAQSSGPSRGRPPRAHEAGVLLEEVTWKCVGRLRGRAKPGAAKHEEGLWRLPQERTHGAGREAEGAVQHRTRPRVARPTRRARRTGQQGGPRAALSATRQGQGQGTKPQHLRNLYENGEDCHPGK